jgi:hypothetical protein
VRSTRTQATIRINAVGGSQEPIPCDGPFGLGHLVLITSGVWERSLCLHRVVEGYSGPPVLGRQKDQGEARRLRLTSTDGVVQ